MTAVIGEIPSPERALREFHRVLAPTGTLAFSEILLDPDYPLSSTLMRMAAAAGFRLRKRVGSFFYYTLVFEKALAAAP
jgi:ubiquinone/menaquinone biosynthesis C-methylase UbiE